MDPVVVYTTLMCAFNAVRSHTLNIAHGPELSTIDKQKRGRTSKSSAVPRRRHDIKRDPHTQLAGKRVLLLLSPSSTANVCVCVYTAQSYNVRKLLMDEQRVTVRYSHDQCR